MDLMFLLELKHDSGRFLTLYTRFVGDKSFFFTLLHISILSFPWKWSYPWI